MQILTNTNGRLESLIYVEAFESIWLQVWGKTSKKMENCYMSKLKDSRVKRLQNTYNFSEFRFTFAFSKAPARPQQKSFMHRKCKKQLFAYVLYSVAEFFQPIKDYSICSGWKKNYVIGFQGKGGPDSSGGRQISNLLS